MKKVLGDRINKIINGVLTETSEKEDLMEEYDVDELKDSLVTNYEKIFDSAEIEIASVVPAMAFYNSSTADDVVLAVKESIANIETTNSVSIDIESSSFRKINASSTDDGSIDSSVVLCNQSNTSNREITIPTIVIKSPGIEPADISEFSYSSYTSNSILISAYNGDRETLYLPKKFTIDGVDKTAVYGNLSTYNSSGNFITKHIIFENGARIGAFSSYDSEARQCLYLRSMRALEDVDFGNPIVGYMTPSGYAFTDCTNLTNLDLTIFPNAFNNTTLGTYMFGNLVKCSSINLTGVSFGKLADTTRMFSNCQTITTLDLRGFNMSSVISAANMFDGCKNLKEILVSKDKWVISDTCNISNMFNGCGVDHVTYAS